MAFDERILGELFIPLIKIAILISALRRDCRAR